MLKLARVERAIDWLAKERHAALERIDIPAQITGQILIDQRLLLAGNACVLIDVQLILKGNVARGIEEHPLKAGQRADEKRADQRQRAQQNR